MIGAWLLEPDRRSYKLDDLYLEMDMQLTSFSQVVEGDKRDDAFSRVSLSAARDYSCEDVFASLCLFEKQRPLLEEKKIWSLFADIECPLVPVLAEMELTGIAVDTHLIKNLSGEFGEKLTLLEQDIYRSAGREFNINSSQQLAAILFEELHLPAGRKTKTGYSTDVKVLERLKQYHDVPGLVLEYRNIAKLKTTYADNLSRLCKENTGRVHTSYTQCGTATGRLSSSNPNLQNIPIRTAEGRRIRSTFIASPGHMLVSGDYSQIDLRVLAHYSRDPALLEAFHSGQDVHRRTAAEIFNVSPELITQEMRRVAKTINFGIIYGMSSFGLASQLDIGRKEAQRFIDRYFASYSSVRNFMETVVEKAREDGFVTTLLGRRRALPDLKSSNRNKREFAERVAINTPIQGTAADIIKLAMLAVNRELKKSNLRSRMILQIHDELVMEVANDEVTECKALVQFAMENVMNLAVPLIVNLETSSNLEKT
jgi:DNA polymerase-1